MKKLWDQVNTVPDWVDWEQIQRGQDTFYRYGAAAITGLAFQSLLGGMGAARVTETLARTGGFSPKVARGRLCETTQHILQCTKDLQSMQPGGDGWISTIRVRFLHAAVRRRILKLAKDRPEYYDVKAFGIPINDLDAIGTISVFSGTLIWMSFPRQGIYMRKQETEDYVALWRYIAWVIGCPTEHFASAAKAKAIMESLFENEVQPNEMGALLANNIIKSIENEPPTYESADMLCASARWLNGNQLSDALKVPNPGLYYWVCTMKVNFIESSLTCIGIDGRAVLGNIINQLHVQVRRKLGQEEDHRIEKSSLGTCRGKQMGPEWQKD